MSEDKAKEKQRPLWARWVRWGLLCILLGILLLSLAWAGLQTRWAKDRLSAWIASATAGIDGCQVALQGLGGRLPFSLLIDRITLSDAEGAWLDGRHVAISLRPAALLAGMLDVNWFRVEALSLFRHPQSTQAPPEKAPVDLERPPPSLPRVRVREIAIDRMDLGKEVAGAPLSYRLESSAQSHGPQVHINALLQDLDRTGDALRLKAAYDLKTERIEADLDYRESEGGLAAGLIGLSNVKGISLQLKANGPLSRVKGRLDLNAGGYGKAGLDGEVSLTDGVSLTVDGHLSADPSLVPADVAASLGGLEIDVQCRADVSSEGMVHIRSFQAKAPSSAVSVQGTADLARGLLDLQVTTPHLNVSPFLRGAGIAIQGLGPVQLTAMGTFRQPEITLSTRLKEFVSRDVALKEITLETRGAFDSDYRGLKKVNASLTVKQVTIPQIPEIDGPLRADVAATSSDFRIWNVKGLQLTARDIVVSSQDARIDTERGQLSAELFAQLDRFAALLPSGTGDIDGQATLRAHAEVNTTARQAQADLHVDLAGLSGLPPLTEEVVGPKLTLKAHAGVNDGMATLEDAHLSGDHFELNAGGRLHLAKGTLDGQYRLSLTDLSPIGEALSMEVSGRMESEGRFSGGLEDVSANIAISFEGLRLNDLDLKQIHTRLEIEGLPERPSGSVGMKGTAMNQPFQLNTAFAWSGDTLAISGARAALPGIDLRADFAITPQNQHFSGTADAKITSLKLVSALSGLDLQGSGRVQLKAGASAPQGEMTLDAAFKDLGWNGHHIPTLRIRGRLDDMMDLRGRLSVEAANAVFKNVRLTTLKAETTGNLRQAVANVEAKGSMIGTAAHDGPPDVPVSFSAGLHMTHDDVWRLRMERFRVLLGDRDIVLARPATVTLHDQEIALDNLELNAATGRLLVNGQIGQHTVQASAQIIDLPLALFNPLINQALTGTVSADCGVSGPIADPDVHAEMSIRGYRLPLGDGKTDLLIEAGVNADRRGDRFEAGITLTGLDKTPFTAKASLPVRLSLKPFALDLDRAGDIRGGLKGHLDLTVLKGFPGMDDQILAGDIDMGMGVAGTLNDWELSGGIDIRRGRYENPSSGTILADINGRLHADGRTLRLTRLTATDGEAGTIALGAHIATEAPFPMNADLAFHQAALLRKDVLTSTASGKLDLKGTPGRLDLTGDIILNRTELQIPRRLPPDVVVIPVREINLPPGMSREAAGPPKDSKRLFMDLAIQIPSRFFVRGRGLDAEFNGQLTAQGPADSPVIRGTLNVVRGTFQFMTRTFHITHGQIAFDGATPPVPLLNITTQVNAGQIDAQIQVTGPADDFKLTLTSQPPLPQDEIMANILFGQSVAKLNPFQAYQLAASISQLSGGGIPDIMGKTRGLLGVDRLSISGGDDSNKSDRGPTISAGKYVSERVYVGVEQELTDAKQDVVIEVDITPNFSVESRAGSRSGAGIGFNWKYDY